MTARSGRVFLFSLALALSTTAFVFPQGEGAEAAQAGGRTVSEAAMTILKTTFWGVLAFAIVIGILWKFLFPPITAALDRRAQMIRESLEAAERAKKEAEEMMAKHEASLELARAESRAIIEEGKADANRVKEGIIQSARKESEEIAERAKREIHLAKQAAVDELFRQATRLSFEVAEKVIERSLRPDDHRELVERGIREYRDKVLGKGAG